MNIFRKNLSWIFFGNIVHAICQFTLNIYCADAFGAFDYGVLNYIVSLMAFFTAIGTLGFNGVITNFFAKEEKNAGSYLGTTIFVRILFSLLSIIFLQVIIYFDDGYNRTLAIVVLCQSIQILFGTADLFIYWFRYKNQAKEVALLRLFAFFISAVWRFFAIYYKDLIWYSLGVSIEFGIFSLLLLWLYRKEYKRYKLCYDRSVLLDILSKSYPFIFSSLMVTIYAQTDKIMLKNMLDYSSVGLYSVSLTLAGAISIIPTALIEGFRPEIMILKQKNENRYLYRLQQLYGIIFWLCFAYCLFITIFSKQIMLMLYGEQYIGAVQSLSVIVWYSSFSFFGAVNNLYMVAEGKTFWVQIITLIGAVLNVVLNFIFIPWHGLLGAAIASLVTQVFANYFLIYIIKPLKPCFMYMNRGISLKWL